jgi:hypothetical protein
MQKKQFDFQDLGRSQDRSSVFCKELRAVAAPAVLVFRVWFKII